MWLPFFVVLPLWVSDMDSQKAGRSKKEDKKQRVSSLVTVKMVAMSALQKQWCFLFPTNLSVIEKVITLTKRTRVIVLLEGKLCKQKNPSFCLTCDQAFSFSGKVLFPSPPKQKGRKIAWSQVTFCPNLLAPRGRIERLLLVRKSGEALCAK